MASKLLGQNVPVTWFVCLPKKSVATDHVIESNKGYICCALSVTRAKERHQSWKKLSPLVGVL